MKATFLTLLFTLSSANAFCKYDKIKKEIIEQMQMHENIRCQTTDLHGQWYLEGVKVGLNIALIIIKDHEKTAD